MNTSCCQDSEETWETETKRVSTALGFSPVKTIVSIDYVAHVLYDRLSLVLIGSDPPRHGVSSVLHAE